MNFLLIIKKCFVILSIYLAFDIIFFYFIPIDLKSKLYNNRAHRIKSFYYHHDLRPMASFHDHKQFLPQGQMVVAEERYNLVRHQ